MAPVASLPTTTLSPKDNHHLASTTTSDFSACLKYTRTGTRVRNVHIHGQTQYTYTLRHVWYSMHVTVSGFVYSVSSFCDFSPLCFIFTVSFTTLWISHVCLSISRSAVIGLFAVLLPTVLWKFSSLVLVNKCAYYYLGIEFLGNKVFMCLVLIDMANQFYPMVATVYFPTSNGVGLQLTKSQSTTSI